MENLWETVFSLSGTFFGLKPSKMFSESDVFGVQSSDTGLMYYISIMGELGEAYSKAAYQGSDALNQFWYLKEAKD